MKNKIKVLFALIIHLMMVLLSYGSINSDSSNSYLFINPDHEVNCMCGVGGGGSVSDGPAPTASISMQSFPGVFGYGKRLKICVDVTSTGSGSDTMHVFLHKYESNGVTKCQIGTKTIDSAGEYIVYYTPPAGYYNSPYISAYICNSWGVSCPVVFTHSFYVAKALYSSIGYDGNDTIYLSNTCQPTESIYGNINLPGANKSSTPSSDVCPNVIIGNESYTEFESGSKLIIEVNVGETGAGKIDCIREVTNGGDICASSYPDKMTFSIEMSGNGPEVDMLKHNGNGYGMNITSDGKALKESNDIASLMLDGMSLLPVAGYAVTAYEASMTAYNLIHCLTSKDTSCSNNEAGVTFHIKGGNYSTSDKCSYVKSGQNVYSAGTCAYICIPNSDLSVNRTLTLTYQNYYVQGSSAPGLKAGAEAKETINAVTASAIYGHVDYTGTHNVDRVNNRHVYIKDTENGEYYQVPIVNGHYLFYAEPGTEYSIYTHSLNKLNKLTTINGSELKDGSSKCYVIYSDDL